MYGRAETLVACFHGVRFNATVVVLSQKGRHCCGSLALPDNVNFEWRSSCVNTDRPENVSVGILLRALFISNYPLRMTSSGIFTLYTHAFGTREVGGFSDDINDKYPHFHQAQHSSDVRKLSHALCPKAIVTAYGKKA